MRDPRHALQFHAARALALLPPPWQVRLSGGAPVEIDGHRLHPEVQLLLAAAKPREIRFGKSTSAEAVRRRMSKECRISGGAPQPVFHVENLTVDGPVGKLRARHYAPSGARGAPLVVFFHGGGFVFGDVDTHDAPCRMLCHHAGVHVLSVDYRLAPEHPFPAAVDDAFAAFRWARAHAESLGADPRRIGVAGDSAGGNLAAVVSQLARDGGEPGPACQVLLYPATDRTRAHPSVGRFSEGFFLTHEMMSWFSMHYHHGVDPHDPRLSPLAARSFEHLPPALVVTAAFDPLRDEGEAYGEALRHAGGQVIVRRFDGLIHGFVNLVGISRASRDALVEVAGATRALFALASSPKTAHAPRGHA